MTTRSEREKALKLNEQHQAILSKMLREDDNKYCADCEAKGRGAQLTLIHSFIHDMYIIDNPVVTCFKSIYILYFNWLR